MRAAAFSFFRFLLRLRVRLLLRWRALVRWLSEGPAGRALSRQRAALLGRIEGARARWRSSHLRRRLVFLRSDLPGAVERRLASHPVLRRALRAVNRGIDTGVQLLRRPAIGWSALLLFAALAIALASPARPSQHDGGPMDDRRAALRVRQGVAELQGWNPERDGPVALKGEWQFFARELVAPSPSFRTTWREANEREPLPEARALASGNATDVPREEALPAPDSLAEPGLRSDWLDDSGFGYASYRLIVELPPHQEALALFVPELRSAGRLFWNGQLLYERGAVARRASLFVPERAPGVVYLPEARGEGELVLHLAHQAGGLPGLGAGGGLAGDFWMGRAADLDDWLAPQRNRALAWLAGFAVLALYALARVLVYLYADPRRKRLEPEAGGRAAAWTALYAAMGFVALAPPAIGASPELAQRCTAIAIGLGAPAALAHLRAAIPRRISAGPMRLFGLAGLVLVCGALVLNPESLAVIQKLFTWAIFLTGLYAAFGLVRSVRTGHPAAVPLYLGLGAAGLGMLHDTLQGASLSSGVSPADGPGSIAWMPAGMLLLGVAFALTPSLLRPVRRSAEQESIDPGRDFLRSILRDAGRRDPDVYRPAYTPLAFALDSGEEDADAAGAVSAQSNDEPFAQSSGEKFVQPNGEESDGPAVSGEASGAGVDVSADEGAGDVSPEEALQADESLLDEDTRPCDTAHAEETAAGIDSQNEAGESKAGA